MSAPQSTKGSNFSQNMLVKRSATEQYKRMPRIRRQKEAERKNTNGGGLVGGMIADVSGWQYQSDVGGKYLNEDGEEEQQVSGLRKAAAALWRVALTPIDTLKTTLQVEGPAAYAILMEKVGEHGIGTLYAGCAATWLASFVGGYPWFATFNALDSRIPHAPPNKVPLKLARSALLGVSATAVSDTIANSLRVLKTTRQTSATHISYTEAARLVVSTDGWVGLFSRGLGTRLLTNMIQASLFTVVWKLMEERLAARDTAAAEMAKASAEVPPPPVAAAAANPTPDQACDAEQEGQ